jgi:glycerol-3-phosphate acyltransferase PlsY
VVFLIDFLKGMLPIIILKLFSVNIFSVHAVALLGCIYAHSYNPWLKLNGGRGLASAAGGTAILFPFVLIVWMILWVIFYFMKMDITIANVTASIFSLILTLSSLQTAQKYSFPKPETEAVLVLFSLGLFIIIISKHTQPLQEIFKSMKTNRGIKR